jgi:hypothetical protein
VLAVVCEEFKVLQSVVVLFLVDVMDDLFGFEEPSEMFFHDEAVFADITE